MGLVLSTDMGLCEAPWGTVGCCERLCAVRLCGMERGAVKWWELLRGVAGSGEVLGSAVNCCGVVFGGGVVCGARWSGVGWCELSAWGGCGRRRNIWCMWRSQVDWLERRVERDHSGWF